VEVGSGAVDRLNCSGTSNCPIHDHSWDSSDVRFLGLSGECSDEGTDAIDPKETWRQCHSITAPATFLAHRAGSISTMKPGAECPSWLEVMDRHRVADLE
jgi:hypothetical protein